MTIGRLGSSGHLHGDATAKLYFSKDKDTAAVASPSLIVFFEVVLFRDRGDELNLPVVSLPAVSLPAALNYADSPSELPGNE